MKAGLPARSAAASFFTTGRDSELPRSEDVTPLLAALTCFSMAMADSERSESLPPGFL